MRTSKSISNIGYMSSSAFQVRADDLRRSGAIGPCFWIAHKAETNETKDHLHILLPGDCMVYETIGLDGLFGYEITPNGKATLTSLWRKTKDITEWLLYAIHEGSYLAHKGQFNKTPYSWTDVKCTKGDEALLSSFIDEAKEALDNQGDKVYKYVRMAIKQGWSWRKLATSGLLPIATLGNARYLYDTMLEMEQKPEALQADGEPPRPPERQHIAQAVLAEGRPPA